jgi:hypothetical protein
MNILKRSFIVAVSLFSTAYAGNEDRSGSAGSPQLLVNPWARSSALASANVSSARGLEAQFMNIAGLAYSGKTELIFARTNWMGSLSGIGMNAFGLAQRINDNSAISFSVMSLNFGDIPITNYDNPEGGIGNFSPVSNLFSVGYAKLFSETISGGINFKVISESISSVKAQGIALDAGVRYTTGENDQIKFAISLKNVGPAMNYSGDGLSIETINPVTGISTTTQQRSQKFELPSQLLIGGSYDFIISEEHLITLSGTFISNAFSKDQFASGLEYKFETEKAVLTLRGGLLYENAMFNAEESRTINSGPTAGISFDFPMGKNGTLIGIDYAYRTSNPFGGIHTIGARINVK